ncbi:MAG: AAA family ATPase [Deltaproteobacteria bacterium]|nr:AAA family ATPase [Deltaproteobacteria bacterium]
MDPNQISVRLAIDQKEIRSEFEKIIPQMEGFSLQRVGDSEPADLLIMELGEDLMKAFQHIHFLQASGEIGEIFLTSLQKDPDILIRILRMGIKEFFHQPVNKDEIRKALIRFRARKLNLSQIRGKGKILHLIGSKGGVGTTTVAVNLATSLRQLEKVQSVALVDMKLFFGEIPLFLDMRPSFDWGEIVKNINRVDATFLMSILSRHSSGVHVLPSPTILNGLAATPEMSERLLNLLKATFDFIVIDGGQSLNKAGLKMLELSDFVLLVAELNLSCLTNLKRLLWAFKELGFPGEEKVRIIINRYQRRSLISREEAEKSINKRISWFIPNDYSTTTAAINQGRTPLEIEPKTEISKNFREFSSTFMETQEEESGKSWTWGGNLFNRKMKTARQTV